MRISIVLTGIEIGAQNEVLSGKVSPRISRACQQPGCMDEITAVHGRVVQKGASLESSAPQPTRRKHSERLGFGE
jgi:hypothetical protein